MRTALNENTIEEGELYARSHKLSILINVCKAYRAEGGARLRVSDGDVKTASPIVKRRKSVGNENEPVKEFTNGRGHDREHTSRHTNGNTEMTSSSAGSRAGRNDIHYNQIYQQRDKVQGSKVKSDANNRGNELTGKHKAFVVGCGTNNGEGDPGPDSGNVSYTREHLLNDLYGRPVKSSRVDDTGFEEKRVGNQYDRQWQRDKEKEKEKEKESNRMTKPKSGGIYKLLLQSQSSSTSSNTGANASPRQGQGQKGDGTYSHMHAQLLVNSSADSTTPRSVDASGGGYHVKNSSSANATGAYLKYSKNSPDSLTGASSDTTRDRHISPNKSNDNKKNSNGAGNGNGHKGAANSLGLDSLRETADKLSTITNTNTTTTTSNNNNNTSLSAVPIHLRPKSAFGRSSVEGDPSRQDPLKRAPRSSFESSSSGTPSMYEELTHNTHRMNNVSGSQEVRRYKSAVKHPDMSHPSTSTSTSALIVDPGSTDSKSNGIPRKYSSSGRVTVNSGYRTQRIECDDVNEGNGNRNRGGAGGGEEKGGGRGGGGGSRRVGGPPAVFKALEKTIQSELAAEAVLESETEVENENSSSSSFNRRSPSLSLSNTLRDDGSGVVRQMAQMGEGNVRQSLMLLKARSKSVSVVRTRHSSGGSATGHDSNGDESVTDETEHKVIDRNGSSGSSGNNGAYVSTVNNRYASENSSMASESSSKLSSTQTLTPHRLATLKLSSIPVGNTAGIVGSDFTTNQSATLRNKSKSSYINQLDRASKSTFESRNQRSAPSFPCPHCGRNFGSEPLERHIKICAKIFSKKRRVFDSAKMRGVEVEVGLSSWAKPRKSVGLNSTSTNSRMSLSGGRGRNNEKGSDGVNGENRGEGGERGGGREKSKWRIESEMFRQSLKAARINTDTNSNTSASSNHLHGHSPVRTVDPSLMPCPHCNRRYVTVWW